MLTDTHAHLASRQFKTDAGEAVSRAAAAGVTRIITIGTDPEDSEAGLRLSEAHPGVEAAVGVHPTSAHEITDPGWLEQIRELAQHSRCVALGEAGLDYFHPAPQGWTERDYRSRQVSFFQAQLALAAELGKNIVIHQRDRQGEDCWRDILRLMEPYHGRLRAVFHCWILPWAYAVPIIERGHLISFTGIATYPKAPEVLAAAAAATEGSFMLETDSPFLPPAPRRGRRNEPAYTRLTAEAIAEARGMELADLARVTSAAAADFFRT